MRLLSNHELRPQATIAGMFIVAIVSGILVAVAFPSAGAIADAAVDLLIVTLLSLVIATTPWQSLRGLSRVPRTAVAALALGFVAGPAIAWLISAALPVDPVVALGIFLFCLFPCTDWFLGFTRLAGGDTTTGMGLIPLSLALQVGSFPVIAAWVGLAGTPQSTTDLFFTVATWLIAPVVLGLTLRLGTRATARSVQQREAIRGALDQAVPAVVAALIMAIFAGNGRSLLEHPELIPTVVIGVLAFFTIMGFLALFTGRVLGLPRGGTTLLVITASARNAPLLLALTAAAAPEQPLLLTVIAIGMLVEFPHLIAVTVLRRGGANCAATRVHEPQNGSHVTAER